MVWFGSFVPAYAAHDQDARIAASDPGQTTDGPLDSVTDESTSGGSFKNPLTHTSSLTALLGAVLDGIINIATIFLVLVFVWVGFKFVTAQGNDEKLAEARKALIWSVIGALILLGAKIIAAVVAATANGLN